MPVCRISDDCWQIRRFNLMNCYLVREEDGLTLVDTALGAAGIIREAARLMGQPIRRILLTHAHLDHVGSLDALKEAEPGTEAWIGEREAQLQGEAQRGIKPVGMTLRADEAQTPVKGGFKKLRHAPERVVKHGERVGSLRAIDTAGHTPGHLAFLDERNGNLFAGDALTTFEGVRLPFDPAWYFPLPKGGTWHFPTALASARRLLDYDVKRILAGHGPAAGDAKKGLERAIARGTRVAEGR